MDLKRFDHLAAAVTRGETRHNVSRALGLSGLGALALAAGLKPLAGEAKRKGKNKKRKNGKRGKPDVNRLCKRQVDACPAALLRNCELSPEACQGTLACCPLLATCDFTEFILCVASRPGGSETAATSLLPFALEAPSVR